MLSLLVTEGSRLITKTVHIYYTGSYGRVGLYTEALGI